MIVSNEQELSALKEIGGIVAFVLQEMGKAACPGMTTKELDMLGKKLLADSGAVSAPISCYDFPGYTCISVNDVVAHGIPGDLVLKEGDSVNIDVSASKNGIFADTAATFLLEPIKHHKQKLVDCSKRALEKAIQAAVAGNRLADLGRVVEKEAHKSGFKTIQNLCGHGVGNTLHDDPESIFNYYEKKDKRILRPGMVLAIEPFISEKDEYVVEENDGWTLRTPHHSLTAQCEHSVVVTEGDAIILTLLPK
ncbi:MAG: type I methionyl aminopeptidase [Clostridiales bacterium]